jgi:hypothetical protein
VVGPALVELDERVDGERALGVELERAFVGEGGPIRVVEHVALGLADAAQERGPALVVRNESGLLLENVDDR